mgnify:CR=1 FL=1
MSMPCGCPTEPPNWDGKDIDLGGNHAHTLPIPMFMHMPIAYGLYLDRQRQLVEKLDLKERWPGLVLSRTGFFRGSLTRLLEATHSPSRHIQVLPSPFKVRAVLHRGNVSTSYKVIQRMQAELIDASRAPKELYMCHLTCPHCEERKGGEQILLLRRWEESAFLKRRQTGRA